MQSITADCTGCYSCCIPLISPLRCKSICLSLTTFKMLWPFPALQLHLFVTGSKNSFGWVQMEAQWGPSKSIFIQKRLQILLTEINPKSQLMWLELPPQDPPEMTATINHHKCTCLNEEGWLPIMHHHNPLSNDILSEERSWRPKWRNNQHGSWENSHYYWSR